MFLFVFDVWLKCVCVFCFCFFQDCKQKLCSFLSGTELIIHNCLYQNWVWTTTKAKCEHAGHFSFFKIFLFLKLFWPSLVSDLYILVTQPKSRNGCYPSSSLGMTKLAMCLTTIIFLCKMSGFFANSLNKPIFSCFIVFQKCQRKVHEWR